MRQQTEGDEGMSLPRLEIRVRRTVVEVDGVPQDLDQVTWAYEGVHPHFLKNSDRRWICVDQTVTKWLRDVWGMVLGSSMGDGEKVSYVVNDWGIMEWNDGERLEMELPGWLVKPGQVTA